MRFSIPNATYTQTTHNAPSLSLSPNLSILHLMSIIVHHVDEKKQTNKQDPLSADGILPPAPPLPSGREGLHALLGMLPDDGGGGGGDEAKSSSSSSSSSSSGGASSAGAASKQMRTTVGRRMGFTALTPIQRYAVPLAFAGRDLICSAATAEAVYSHHHN